MQDSIVVMGVAGCGKSSLARSISLARGLPFIEGDDFHSAANRAKMAQGIALTDDDRAQWLSLLVDEIRNHPKGVVLTCSALKKAYRDQLRRGASNLKFVFLDLDREEALRRVQGRGAGHFFPAALVDSQFATLESPMGETRVLKVDATRPMDALQRQVVNWLQAEVEA